MTEEIDLNKSNFYKKLSASRQVIGIYEKFEISPEHLDKLAKQVALLLFKNLRSEIEILKKELNEIRTSLVYGTVSESELRRYFLSFYKRGVIGFASFLAGTIYLVLIGGLPIIIGFPLSSLLLVMLITCYVNWMKMKKEE